MKYTFPHTIENSHGEKIIFKSIGGEKLWLESFCASGSGPIMHTPAGFWENINILITHWHR